MTATFRWVLAGLLVVGAAALVFDFDPTTCHIDVCRSNLATDVGTYVAGLAATLVLTVGKG
jgi:hypothetical protein